jgi:hypothetical protein
MHTNGTLLDDPKKDSTCDASDLLTSYLSDNENVSQFFQTNISSSYHDCKTFIDAFKNTSDPIILSLNIQSLNSKYGALKLFTKRLQDFDIPIDLILLQETWEIKFPEQFSLPGFQNIVFRTREGGRGGGVGIYVRNGLNFKIRTDLESYKLKT